MRDEEIRNKIYEIKHELGYSWKQMATLFGYYAGDSIRQIADGSQNIPKRIKEIFK